jgi:hypothetical protein
MQIELVISEDESLTKALSDNPSEAVLKERVAFIALTKKVKKESGKEPSTEEDKCTAIFLKIS